MGQLWDAYWTSGRCALPLEPTRWERICNFMRPLTLEAVWPFGMLWHVFGPPSIEFERKEELARYNGFKKWCESMGHDPGPPPRYWMDSYLETYHANREWATEQWASFNDAKDQEAERRLRGEEPQGSSYDDFKAWQEWSGEHPDHPTVQATNQVAENFDWKAAGWWGPKGPLG